MLLLSAGCGKESTPTPAPPVVEVLAAVQKDVPIYSEWVGSMDGNVNAVIRPQVTGYLVKQNYREGEFVKKGQVLFEIDPRTFQASLDESKAQVSAQQARHTTAKANLARIRPLAAKNAVSQKDLDDAVGTELSARSSVEASQAAMASAQLNLEFTRIISPIDGIAGIAKAQTGDLLSPNAQTELTTVSAVNPIKVYINLSEREYLRFSASHVNAEKVPLELILADESVYPQSGRFSLADRQVDPTTGTLKVIALFPNPGNRLRPGQFGKIKATTTVRKGALLVPQRAVTELQGKYLVAVVGADNKAEIRPVKVAERIGTDWIIAEGLKPGEKVVAEGTQKVRPGMSVAAKPFAPEAPAAPGTPPKTDVKQASPAPAAKP